MLLSCPYKVYQLVSHYEQDQTVYQTQEDDWEETDKIQARMNISLESKIFRLSTNCRIEVYT